MRRGFKSIDAAHKLKDFPAVKSYLAAEEAARKPRLSEEEQKKQELNELYDDLFFQMGIVNKYLMILSELAYKDTNVDISDTGPMIDEIYKHLSEVNKVVARTFELGGIVKDETQSILDDMKMEAKKAV